MATDLLSDRQCSGAKGKTKVYYRNDGKGLRLQVRPDGVKYWMLRYLVTTADGTRKESTNGLGRYPDVSLTDARVEARKARALIAAGHHPTAARRVERAQQAESRDATFKSLSVEWLERCRADWSPHYYERNEGLLRRVLWDDLGRLPIVEISEPVLLKALRKTYDAGQKESARRARAVAASVFQYAKDTHRADSNPARELASSSLLKKPDVRHFAAMQKDQVGPFLRAMVKSETEDVTRVALVLMLYTGLRDFALRAAKWDEINLETATWTVPAERMKSGRVHTIPLPTQAVEMLTVLAAQTRRKPDAYVFASRGKAGFLAENTLRVRLHALGFKVTAHGFRSLMTDLLNEQGFNADAIERQLDHVERNKVRAAYLRSEFIDYRRTMMQWLADWADAQRKKTAVPELPSNVVPLRQVA